jgi:hypothetical protein
MRSCAVVLMSLVPIAAAAGGQGGSTPYHQSYDNAALRGETLIDNERIVWIVENNHQGIQCGGGYASGRYATHEVGRGSPGAFIKWYMTDVVPAAERHTEPAGQALHHGGHGGH